MGNRRHLARSSIKRYIDNRKVIAQLVRGDSGIGIVADMKAVFGGI